MSNHLPSVLSTNVLSIGKYSESQSIAKRCHSRCASRPNAAKENSKHCLFSSAAVQIELTEVVDFFTKPERFQASGARVPKGILLCGPPGTGKTLLARAVAGEARVSFLSLNASEFVEMFAGLGASRVRDLFNQVCTSLEECGAFAHSYNPRLINSIHSLSQTAEPTLKPSTQGSVTLTDPDTTHATSKF